MDTMELDPKYFCNILIARIDCDKFDFLCNWDSRCTGGETIPLKFVQHEAFEYTVNCCSCDHGIDPHFERDPMVDWNYARDIMGNLSKTPMDYPGFIEIHPDVIPMIKKHHIELTMQTMTIEKLKRGSFNYLRILAHGSPEDLLLFKLSI